MDNLDAPRSAFLIHPGTGIPWSVEDEELLVEVEVEAEDKKIVEGVEELSGAGAGSEESVIE